MERGGKKGKRKVYFKSDIMLGLTEQETKVVH